MRGPANQDGIFRMSRTGMPGTMLACSILRINPDAEWSRVCTISTTTCTCSDEVPGSPDAGLNASNTSPGLTPSARPIDEDDLLGTGEHVEIPLGDYGALEPSLDRRGTHLSRVLERLERQRQMALVDATELHHQDRKHLPPLGLGHARYAHRHEI